MNSQIETDVLIVGAGPAGLSAALALKRKGYDGRVVVLEKSKSIGGHVLSGAVIDPSGFAELLTEAEIAALPCEAKVTRESFRLLASSKLSFAIPWVPPMMQQKGYPICSLTKVVQYLAKLAEAAGVEIYTGYAVESLIEENGVVIGARTGAKGVDHEDKPKANFLAAEEIRAKVTLLAEGACGILTDRLIRERGLAGITNQNYAIGIKELFEYAEPKVGSGGEIMHTFGWPIDTFTYGGGCVYHLNDRQVAVIYALGLDYADPKTDPHELFRKFKASKTVQCHLKGAKAVAYGAKVIPEGGYWAMPRMTVPGAMILGDGAGLVDGLRIKGVHLAIQSAIAAASAIVGGGDYETLFKATSGYREIRRVRNVHGGFTYAAPIGVMMAGMAWLFRGAIPWWPFGRHRRDCATMNPLAKCRDGAYAPRLELPGPDRLTDVFMSGTIHEENQPCHLKLRDPAKCRECAECYGRPCTRFCPAEVYRIEDDGRLQIDFSNCLHCKTCQQKCPMENVEWTFPQGGDGPRYTRM